MRKKGKMMEREWADRRWDKVIVPLRHWRMGKRWDRWRALQSVMR